MLRAPICTTSACSAIASACVVSRNSVTTGSPVSARASARISSPGTPSPLNANGEVRGLNAPPRSIDAPPALTIRATSSVCSRDSTVHGPAIRQNVALPPTVRPLTLNALGALWLSSSEASLYGREIGTTRSTPAIPSRPSVRTPSGSPIAPIAVVSSPGITSTCTPVVSSRLRTAAISASPASGVITIIIAAGTLQAELADPELVRPEVVCQLVAHRPRHLVAQQVRVVPEVAQQRVAEDDDAVVIVVARDGVALVEAVSVRAAPLVGDHDRDAIERLDQDVRQIVQRLAHERLEVLAVVRVQLEELLLAGLDSEVLARELLGPHDQALEVGLVLGL